MGLVLSCCYIERKVYPENFTSLKEPLPVIWEEDDDYILNCSP